MQKMAAVFAPYLLQLETAEGWKGFQLLHQLLFVIERIFRLLCRRLHQSLDQFHTRADESGDHLWHVLLKLRRTAALEVRHRCDEA